MICENNIPEKAYPADWNLRGIHDAMLRTFALDITDIEKWKTDETISERRAYETLYNLAMRRYNHQAEKYGPDAPARFLEYFSPIRGTTKNGGSKLTRDTAQAIAHDADPFRARYFSYGFYYSLFKNLLKLSGHVNCNLPVLIISGGQDLVSINSRLATSLYRIYKSQNTDNVTLLIYPGARHELLMETNYRQIQRDILAFFNSVIYKHRKN